MNAEQLVPPPAHADQLPSVTLLVGSAASGKTEAAMRFFEHHQADGQRIFLVPTRLHRQRVAKRVDPACTHDFSSLAAWVLRRAGTEPTPMDAIMRLMLLRSLLAALAAAGTLPCFAGVAHKHGWVATVGELLTEMEEAECTPAALADARVSPYDSELAAIYRAYRSRLDTLGMADLPRRVALARDTLRDQPGLLASPGPLLIVDGFDQFTPLQVSLLAEIARCASQSVITLTWEASSRPAHRRFERTYATLVKQLRPAVVSIEQEPWAALVGTTPPRSTHPPALRHMHAHLFNVETPPPVEAEGALLLIEAADREREVRATLRHVRTLMQDGEPAEDIAILFRSGSPYNALLREVAREYKLPLALYNGLPLAEAPPVVAILAMLRLPLARYPRRALLEVWRSIADGRIQFAPAFFDTLNAANAADNEEKPALPFAASTFEQAAPQLNQVTRENGIASGLERIEAALQELAQADPATTTASEDEEGHTHHIPPEAASRLLTLLQAFATWLTPPPTPATTADYTAWLEQRLASKEEWSQQWPQEMQCWFEVVCSLAQAAATLGNPQIPYGTFITELEAAVSTAHYGRSEPERGKVAVLNVLAARGFHVRHMIILGMVESEFPLALGNPPIYSRRERAKLAHRGAPLLAPDPADERTLFYETVTRAQTSLTLARTYLDEQGNPLPPSPYLMTLRNLVQPATIHCVHAVAGSVPTLAEAASPQEKLVALAASMLRAGETTPSESEHDATLLAHVRYACRVEQTREAAAESYGPFEGMLDDEEMLAAAASLFGPSHRWSITQFHDYITCPFRFAAAHLLRLTPRTEPEDELELTGRGRIYHAILAEAGKAWIAQGCALRPDQEQTVTDLLKAAANKVFADAPHRYGFEAGPFWEWEQKDIRRRLLHALHRFIHNEQNWHAFAPLQVERGFGLGYGSNPHARPPLPLTTPAGEVLVSGRVDRIDQRADGSLALLDYKSNSKPKSLKETAEGSDVQLTIYLLAVEEVLLPGQRVEQAAFAHLGSGTYSRPLTSREREQAVEAMREQVAETVTNARNGVFRVHPRASCPPGCVFAGICRVNLARQ